MTTISKSNKLVTIINVFTVEPENQQQLIDLLARATETYVRHVPGFISANLHRSLDGTKVAMYAQWRSVEDYQVMRENPAPQPYLQQALVIAKFEPGIYEVVESYSAVAGDA
jgi:quinol monooxygenase YgiN